MSDYALCHQCRAKVPMEYLPEHLAEHDTKLTAQDVRDALVEDETGEDDA